MIDRSEYSFRFPSNVDEYTKKILRDGYYNNAEVPEDYADIFCFQDRGINNLGKRVVVFDFI